MKGFVLGLLKLLINKIEIQTLWYGVKHGDKFRIDTSVKKSYNPCRKE